MLEGILFRVRQVLDDISAGGPPRRVLLSGGLSREPFMAAGLAALLDRKVELLESGEAACNQKNIEDQCKVCNESRTLVIYNHKQNNK